MLRGARGAKGARVYHWVSGFITLYYCRVLPLGLEPCLGNGDWGININMEENKKNDVFKCSGVILYASSPPRLQETDWSGGVEPGLSGLSGPTSNLHF